MHNWREPWWDVADVHRRSKWRYNCYKAIPLAWDSLSKHKQTHVVIFCNCWSLYNNCINNLTYILIKYSFIFDIFHRVERLFSDNNNLWQLFPSRHQRAIKCSEVTFPCTRVKREISRFILEDTRGFVWQNLSQHTRVVGDIPRKHLACCEKRRETTFVSLRLYYIQWRGFTCPARAKPKREVRVGNEHAPWLGAR